MRLTIRNVGPVRNADIDIKKVNILIGPQSSGKSTIAKIISFCTWLEKELLSEQGKAFCEGNEAYKAMVGYHHIEGYLNDNSYICYEGENIAYVFTHEAEPLLPSSFRDWQIEHLSQQEYMAINLQREVTPKVLYIPAERNFVARVPNLSKYNPENDNLTNFVVDWEEAKRKVRNMKLLDTHTTYSHGDDGSDWLLTSDGTSLPLRSASSGLQSLTPLLVLVEWVTRGIYKENKPFSFDDREKLRSMLAHLDSEANDEQQKALALRLQDFLHGKLYTHTQLIIEEPEQNLYPETQHVLLQHLLSAINHGKKHRLLLTTHSPYMLTAFNNAVLAGKLTEQGKDQSVRDIMGEQYDTVSPDSYAAYHINDGKAIDIIDKETGLVNAEFFDDIAYRSGEKFDKLLD